MGRERLSKNEQVMGRERAGRETNRERTSDGEREREQGESLREKEQALGGERASLGLEGLISILLPEST